MMCVFVLFMSDLSWDAIFYIKSSFWYIIQSRLYFGELKKLRRNGNICAIPVFDKTIKAMTVDRRYLESLSTI